MDLTRARGPPPPARKKQNLRAFWFSAPKRSSASSALPYLTGPFHISLGRHQPRSRQRLEQVQPDEVYSLGAISFVKLSFSQPELTAEVSGSGVLRILEAVRIVGGRDNHVRFYQASTSEMFGEVAEVPQRETTPFHPSLPYGTAKVFGYYTTLNYRESYGIHASNGILFNHTSPRRGLEFVERKITNAVARISLGLQDSLALGDISTSRDFGCAGDYVEAMWRILQHDSPGDCVVATGLDLERPPSPGHGLWCH